MVSVSQKSYFFSFFKCLDVSGTFGKNKYDAQFNVGLLQGLKINIEIQPHSIIFFGCFMIIAVSDIRRVE